MAAASSERVELKGLEWFTHHAVVVYLWLVAVASPIALLRSHRASGTWLWLFEIACFVLGALALWQQRRVLRYRLVHTTRSAEANYESVLALAESEGWHVTHREHGRFMQASVRGSWMSWGERVSVRFRGDDVWVNSFCDPERHTSILSFGGNRQHVDDVIEAVGGLRLGQYS